MNDKSNSMYFWRVIFTYIIALHHLRNAYGIGVGWYIAVDFFAILAGFLLCTHADRHTDESIWLYAQKRFKQFVPIVFISVVFRLLIDNHYNHIPLNKYIPQLFASIPEYLLLNGYGICPGINGVDWFLQSLVIPSFFILWLFKRNREFTTQIFAPITAWIFLSALFHRFGYAEGFIPQRINAEGFISWPGIRIFAELCLGVFCYKLTQTISQKYSNKYRIIDTLLFIMVILMSFYHGKTRNDYIYILILGLGIAFAFANNSQNKILNHKYIKYLSSISLYIYLNHYIFRTILRNTFPSYSIEVVSLYLIIITLFSAALHYCYEIIPQKIKHIQN